MRSIIPISSCLFLGTLTAATAHSILTNEWLDNLDRVRIEQNVKGLTIGVLHDGITETAALGIKSEDGDAMTEDTLFHIASCSKSFTAAAMGILIDDFARGVNVTALPPGLDRFDWHSKMKDVLPDEWKLMDPVASDYANIHDILSHVTGLPRHDEVIGADETVIGLVKNLRNLRPSFELREHWSYNNLMYTVTTHVISKYSGKRYIDFVKERLFYPMNMTSTSYSLPDTSNLTSVWTAQGRLIPNHIPETPDFLDMEAGPGGIISNSKDLLRYLTVMVNLGSDPTSGRVVIPEHVWTAVTSAYAVIPRNKAYGMGWITSTYRDTEFISHTGGIPGYTSLLLWVRGKRQGLALLMNGDVAVDLLLHVQYAVLDAFLDSENTHLGHSRLGTTNEDSPQTVLEHKRRAFDSSLEAKDLVGTYSALGYSSNITLCSSLDSPRSPSCSAVLGAFSLLGPLDPTHLYASWADNIWFTHVRLTPRENSEEETQYHFAELKLFADGYGKDNSPFELVVISQVATFDTTNGVVRGFGWSDPIDQPTLRRDGSIEERSVVWFAKVA